MPSEPKKRPFDTVFIRLSFRALPVGAPSAWLRLGPGKLKTLLHPIRPVREAVEVPQG